MRKIYDQNTEWVTFSPSASLKQNETDTDIGSNSSRAILAEIGVVLAGALGLAAVIDIVLTFLQVRPFV